MEQYIPKSALVAEIKRLRDTAFELYGCSQFDSAYNNVLKSIDTLEVKEITSLQEKPVSKVWHDASERPDYNVGKTVIVGYNDDDDLYDECNNVAYHTTLSMLVSRKDLNTRVVRWAYLKDLI